MICFLVTFRVTNLIVTILSHACMVEVAEPGYEAITYSLITTASNAVAPLSAVISYQLLAFFPLLNDQNSIAADTPEWVSCYQFVSLDVFLSQVHSLFYRLAIFLTPQPKTWHNQRVRRQFAALHTIVILLNLSSLISLPLLPWQKKETRWALYAFWLW